MAKTKPNTGSKLAAQQELLKRQLEGNRLNQAQPGTQAAPQAKPEPRGVHPAADLFPMLSDEELADLAADIKANGQKAPILLHDGLILDGRNRLAACKIAGVPPQFKTLPPGHDPISTIVSLNIIRRHLTTSQRAAVAAELADTFKPEATARKLSNLKQGPQSPEAANLPLRAGSTQKQAADTLNVSERSVRDADLVRRQDPEAFEDIKQGRTTVNKAKRQMGFQTQRTALPPPARLHDCPHCVCPPA